MQTFYIECTPSSAGGMRGGWASDQIFKMGSLTGYQFLEGVAGKEGLTGGCRFYIKNKPKSGIFNDKKSL